MRVRGETSKETKEQDYMIKLEAGTANRLGAQEKSYQGVTVELRSKQQEGMSHVKTSGQSFSRQRQNTNTTQVAYLWHRNKDHMDKG